jgi:hypothetical protein
LRCAACANSAMVTNASDIRALSREPDKCKEDNISDGKRSRCATGVGKKHACCCLLRCVRASALQGYVQRDWDEHPERSAREEGEHLVHARIIHARCRSANKGYSYVPDALGHSRTRYVEPAISAHACARRGYSSVSTLLTRRNLRCRHKVNNTTYEHKLKLGCPGSAARSDRILHSLDL